MDGELYITQQLSRFPTVSDIIRQKGSVFLESLIYRKTWDKDDRGWFSLNGNDVDPSLRALYNRPIQVHHLDWTVVTTQFVKFTWRGDSNDMEN